MKSKQRKSKPILSDKIADALTVKPRADIEDDQVFHTKPKTLTRAELSSSESEDEAAISDFRKRNVNLLSDISKKYEGEVVSRKVCQGQSDDSESESKSPTKDDGSAEDQDSDDADESDDYSITKLKKRLESDENVQSGEDNTDEGSDGEEDEEDSDEEGDEEGCDFSQMEEPMEEEFHHVKKQNVSEEAKKGNCVRNQLLLWEGLLEMRINLQRCVNAANRMPMYNFYGQLKENSKFSMECINTVNNVTNVLDKLLSLQNLLFKNFPETKAMATGKQKSEQKKESKQESDEEIPSDTDNEEIPSDTDAEDNIEPEKPKTPKNIQSNNQQKKRKLEDYELDLTKYHKVFKSFRDTTIQKWNDKTRLATAANIKNAPTNTILQQISYILSDKQKLVRRTQLKRSEYDIIGYKRPEETHNQNENQDRVDLNPVVRDRKDNDEYISEIFDDSDFYHQLLRELIECKSADISDPVQLSRQWIALQQMRSKMKRKVDTKATKGRKIKYVVHNKLVNYMAPEKSLTWNDESTNELYSSLFGKMFEQNNIGVNVTLENGKIKI